MERAQTVDMRNRALRGKCGPKKEKMTTWWKILRNYADNLNFL